jgi:hypothetical protein
VLLHCSGDALLQLLQLVLADLLSGGMKEAARRSDMPDGLAAPTGV